MGVDIQASVARASATPTPLAGSRSIGAAQGGVCTQVEVAEGAGDGDAGDGDSAVPALALVALLGAGSIAALLFL